jgi:hypothetical protein
MGSFEAAVLQETPHPDLAIKKATARKRLTITVKYLDKIPRKDDYTS